MTKHDYHNRFLNVLSSSSPEQAANDLCVLANAAWHEGWSPEVAAVPSQLRRKAAYLADFFASNQAMPLEQSRKLKDRLNALKADFSEPSSCAFYTNTKTVRTNRDALAKKWGLAAGLQAKRVPGLLDLQRRSAV